jgi:hypothetical protein
MQSSCLLRQVTRKRVRKDFKIFKRERLLERSKSSSIKSIRDSKQLKMLKSSKDSPSMLSRQ